MTNQLVSGLPKRQNNAKSMVMNKNNEPKELAAWIEQVGSERCKTAFTQLFKYFGPRIQKIARSKYGSEALASDVVQETMTNVWRKSHLFDSTKGNPTTWVYTIMRNVAFDLLRKINSNKEDNFSDDFWPSIESDHAEEAGFDDHLKSKSLASVIGKLPENQRQIIEGFYFQELTQEQLAENLSIPLGTVKSRLRLALAKLKEHVGEDYD
jgi:RNA polymerase sigma-70 factor (ECF subfamily)